MRLTAWMLLWAVLLVAPLALAQGDAAPETVELRVMTFNVWVGGELVDFAQVAEAIRAAQADVVGLQEIGGNAQQLADLLGWPHVNERLHIISRYPLIDPPGADGQYLFVQVFPGQVFAMANVHLTSSSYGPYLVVRDGADLEVVLQNERDTRLAGLQPTLDAVRAVASEGYPILFTGDFNTPSHLDWTPALVEARPEIRYPVAWPVTVAMEHAGFVDTYRAIHPDPVGKVGMTWTPGTPAPRLEAGEVVDRIDLVFATGDVDILDSQIIGERGGADVDIPLWPYPSDHRGVVATVRLTPRTPPLFTAVDRPVVRVGDPIVVRYAAPTGEDADRIVILPADGSAPEDVLMSLPPMEADLYGAVTFGSSMLEPGEYASALLGPDGAEISEARNRFWVLAADAVPEVRATKTIFAEGEPITVEWANAPGHRWDWLGIYPAGESDLYNYLGFLYTRSIPFGSITFDAAALGEAMLPPGDYEVRLMRDDWYVELARGSFMVR